MLVLSRHRDETIIIGDNVAITVIDIRGDKTRIGINAPKDVPVHRLEVFSAIKRQNKQDNLFAHLELRKRSSGLVVPTTMIPTTQLKGGK